MNYTAADIGRQLRGRRRRNRRGEYWEISGYCHGSEDKRDSNSLNTWDYKGSVVVRCYAGCERGQIRAAIERATGLTVRVRPARAGLPKKSEPVSSDSRF